MQSRRTEPDRQEKKEKSGEWEWERRDEGKEGKRKLGLEKRKGPAGPAGLVGGAGKEWGAGTPAFRF